MLLIYRIQDKGRVSVTPFLDLVFVKNTGRQLRPVPAGQPAGPMAAGGLRRRWPRCAMAVWLARGVTDRLVAASLGLIMGGALSNAIDRV